MYIIDSHCHLDRLDWPAALLRAKEHHVYEYLCVCIDLENFPIIRNIAQIQKNVYISVGVHPTEREGQVVDPQELLYLANHPEVIAIGETGLDYVHCTGDISWQQERFRTHIAVAKILKKPLIIHTRDAREDTIHIMRQENADTIGGVMHCFTETKAMAQQALDLNFYISFSGIVTFKNATVLQEVAQYVPLDRILVETDAPYLAPAPYRGKPNEPAYTRYVVEKIAELRQLSPEVIAEHTTENFRRLFKQQTYSVTLKIMQHEEYN